MAYVLLQYLHINMLIDVTISAKIITYICDRGNNLYMSVKQIKGGIKVENYRIL